MMVGVINLITELEKEPREAGRGLGVRGNEVIGVGALGIDIKLLGVRRMNE